MRNIIFGWLLAAQGWGVIAFYETETDCAKAASYVNAEHVNCIPDRFSINEVKE